MKVLHLISSGGMYGAEAVILQLCRTHTSVVGKGESTLAVFAHGENTPALHQAAAHSTVRSQLITCQGQLDRRVPAALRQAAQQAGADIVHAHGYKADIYASLAYRGKQRPALVSTCHTWYDNDRAVRVYGAVDRWVLRGYDEVVAVSAEVRERLLGAGVKAERISTIRNGVDTLRFAQLAAGRQTPTAGQPVTIGLVGRLAPEKGVDLFLEAAAQLSKEFPHARFAVAGEGPDRAALEARRQALGLTDQFAFLGAVVDMEAFYAGADLLVSASRQEGLPMAMLEGMSAGLPVVATRVGEVPTVVVDGETGLLVAPGSVDALAEAIRDLLLSPERRLQFGSASRRRVEHVFSAERMTRDYAEVYQRALDRLGRGHSRAAELAGA